MSSVCRGGLPTQRFVFAVLIARPDPTSPVKDGASPSPPDWVSALERPSPSDEKLPSGGVATSSSSGGTGAYSSVSEGFASGSVRADGRAASNTSSTRAASPSGG